MIGIIVWLVMGACVGWIASLIMKKEGDHGTLVNILVGLVGAGIGGFLFRLFGLDGTNINQWITPYSFMVSVIGAVLLLAIVSALRSRAR